MLEAGFIGEPFKKVVLGGNVLIPLEERQAGAFGDFALALAAHREIITAAISTLTCVH